jgi:hypothetical protein
MSKRYDSKVKLKEGRSCSPGKEILPACFPLTLSSEQSAGNGSHRPTTPRPPTRHEHSAMLHNAWANHHLTLQQPTTPDSRSMRVVSSRECDRIVNNQSKYTHHNGSQTPPQRARPIQQRSLPSHHPPRTHQRRRHLPPNSHPPRARRNRLRRQAPPIQPPPPPPSPQLTPLQAASSTSPSPSPPPTLTSPQKSLLKLPAATQTSPSPPAKSV